MAENLIGFGTIEKAAIVAETVLHLSENAYDFIQRYTDTSATPWKCWQAKQVPFDILAAGFTEFNDESSSATRRPRLYLAAGTCRGKRTVLARVVDGQRLSSDLTSNSSILTDKHMADLKVALYELEADAIRAERRSETDLQTF
jgi:hypothetical protein